MHTEQSLKSQHCQSALHVLAQTLIFGMTELDMPTKAELIKHTISQIKQDFEYAPDIAGDDAPLLAVICHDGHTYETHYHPSSVTEFAKIVFDNALEFCDVESDIEESDAEDYGKVFASLMSQEESS